MLKALVFDLDGTLTDSDPFHRSAFEVLLSPHGYAVDEAFYRERISGRSNSAIFKGLFPDRAPEERDRLADEKEALFRRMASDLRPLEGLLDLLDWADAEGLGLAVVTNAPRLNLAHMLGTLNLDARFRIRVSGEDVARAKPDPLPYLTALEQLGVSAEDAVAFEDSPAGLRAAKAAGLFTFGILTGQTADVLQAEGADATIPDFRDPLVRRILEQRRTGG